MEQHVIDQFKGIYSFLSNFHPAPVRVDHMDFMTSEHAFQALKTVDHGDRCRIAGLKTPGQAKAAGKKVKLRDNWNDIRVEVMRQVLICKFDQNPDLAQKLIETGDAELIEGNTWNDTFWGVCRGKGQNNLGKLLMEIRAKLRERK